MQHDELAGPIVVGGVGGSGTRVVAEWLLQSGFYLGGDLNAMRDNLWFTLLFKRPRWFQSLRAAETAEQISAALRVFGRAMTCGLRASLTSQERSLIRAAADDVQNSGLPLGAGAAQRRSLLACDAPDLARFVGWGWKEPNSHVFLEHLWSHFPAMHYIHVLRNGLDIAFSENRQQLENWGSAFGVPKPAAPRDAPRCALRYWVAANRRVFAMAERFGPQRFLSLHLEDICREPARQAERLLEFLDVPREAALIARLVASVRSPASLGRFRKRDLTSLNPSDVAAIAEFGYAFD